LDVLSAVIKWGEYQLVKRLEERGTACFCNSQHSA